MGRDTLSSFQLLVKTALEKYSGYLVAAQSFWNPTPITPTGREIAFHLHNIRSGRVRLVTYEELSAGEK